MSTISDNFVFDLNYLDIRRTENLVVLQITWNEGRRLTTEEGALQGDPKGLKATLSLRPEAILVEVKRENWSVGDGIAQNA